MKIHRRKLYSGIDEYGAYRHAMIVYQKRDRFFDVMNRGPHPEGQLLSVPVGWSHYLQIDLYFFILEFAWDSGVQRSHSYTLKK